MDCSDGFSFNDLNWMRQNEIPNTVKTALLYGEIRGTGEKADVWIYLDKATTSLIWQIYYPEGDAKPQVITVEEALEKAKPCAWFKLATTPEKLEALATYYFARKKLTKRYQPKLTFEQNRLLKAMLGSEAPSKIVKLRVRVPEYLGREQSPEALVEPQQPSEVVPSQRARSKSTISVHQLPSPCSTTDYDAKRDDESRRLSGATMIEPLDPIDRYFDLEDRMETACTNIKRHNNRIEDLKRKRSEIEKEINMEAEAVELLIAERHQAKVAKDRLWNVLSREEAYELGRLDTARKIARLD
ncbi:uncharacterized protein J4E79_008693 [Alternaria viburni]|uniref:uncharacterized protein n=1 Tax=Alternaria viburni TaxID=566460 RepID=UPI0020C56F54|nr:uncharacterized protein J4E79_008693 [Alternaria viburni]KAI4653180.1 hypothetical protein J4E79_008693 [Alternaria viburni]